MDVSGCFYRAIPSQQILKTRAGNLPVPIVVKNHAVCAMRLVGALKHVDAECCHSKADDFTVIAVQNGGNIELSVCTRYPCDIGLFFIGDHCGRVPLNQVFRLLCCQYQLLSESAACGLTISASRPFSWRAARWSGRLPFLFAPMPVKSSSRLRLSGLWSQFCRLFHIGLSSDSLTAPSLNSLSYLCISNTPFFCYSHHIWGVCPLRFYDVFPENIWYMDTMWTD